MPNTPKTSKPPRMSKELEAKVREVQDLLLAEQHPHMCILIDAHQAVMYEACQSVIRPYPEKHHQSPKVEPDFEIDGRFS